MWYTVDRRGTIGYIDVFQAMDRDWAHELLTKQGLRGSRATLQEHPTYQAACTHAQDQARKSGHKWRTWAQYRPYTCMVCGHEEYTETNHDGPCYPTCRSCGWHNVKYKGQWLGFGQRPHKATATLTTLEAEEAALKRALKQAKAIGCNASIEPQQALTAFYDRNEIKEEDRTHV